MQADIELGTVAAEYRASARQQLRKLCLHYLRDLCAVYGIGLIAHKRQAYKGHVSGAGVQGDVAIPELAFIVHK